MHIFTWALLQPGYPGQDAALEPYWTAAEGGRGKGEGNEREIEGESEKGGLRGKWRVRATDAEEKTRLM